MSITDSDYITVGQCSICGGLVRVPRFWYTDGVSPTPMCSQCGAVKAPPVPSPLPVIPMAPVGQNSEVHWTFDKFVYHTAVNWP